MPRKSITDNADTAAYGVVRDNREISASRLGVDSLALMTIEFMATAR